jgi:hypothetical protein
VNARWLHLPPGSLFGGGSYGPPSSIVLCAFLSLFATTAEPAQADNFTTTLTFVSDLASSVLGVTLQPGQSLVGSVTYQVVRGDNAPHRPDIGDFRAVGNIQLPFTSVPVTGLTVVNNIVPRSPEDFVAPGDFLFIAGFDERVLPGPVGSLSVLWSFHDPSATLLTSDQPPDPSVFERFRLGSPHQRFDIRTSIGGERPRAVDVLVGTLEATAAPAPIPEPSTLLLLATGLAAGVRWHHRKQY